MSDELKKTTDYTSSFEYPSIPQIHGEPDYEQLKNLKDKLKSNATKIPSELGGGGGGGGGSVVLFVPGVPTFNGHGGLQHQYRRVDVANCTNLRLRGLVEKPRR